MKEKDIIFGLSEDPKTKDGRHIHISTPDDREGIVQELIGAMCANSTFAEIIMCAGIDMMLAIGGMQSVVSYCVDVLQKDSGLLDSIRQYMKIPEIEAERSKAMSVVMNLEKMINDTKPKS